MSHIMAMMMRKKKANKKEQELFRAPALFILVLV